MVVAVVGGVVMFKLNRNKKKKKKKENRARRKIVNFSAITNSSHNKHAVYFNMFYLFLKINFINTQKMTNGVGV